MTELRYIPLSALQHWRVCPRQCMLIHLLNVWKENRITAEGRSFHEHVHQEENVCRGGIQRVSGVSLVSHNLGLIGQADVIEFSPNKPPYPIEYKRGRPKKDTCDALQLCAQAICIEEMMNTTITHGALFYGKTHRRQEVFFSTTLREEVKQLTWIIRDALQKEMLPSPIKNVNCMKCSLSEWCHSYKSVHSYLKGVLENDNTAKYSLCNDTGKLDF